MNHSEKRSAERVPIDLPIQLEILIPENTFSTRSYDARLGNLSERGAMIQVELEPEVGTAMLHKTRYSRICFNEPELPSKILGRAVWIQPEKTNTPDRRKLRIGIFFENCPAEDIEKLRKYIAFCISNKKRR